MQIENIERSDKAFKIDYNSKVGRHLISNRDIEPGEIIIDDFPLVLGPSTFVDPNAKCSSDPVSVCPACYLKLSINPPNPDNTIVSKNETTEATEIERKCKNFKPETNSSEQFSTGYVNLSEAKSSSNASLSKSENKTTADHIKTETNDRSSDSEPNSDSDLHETPKVYLCLNCGLTLCSKVCSEKSIHVQNECKLFQGIPLLHTALKGTRDLHQFITTIRCLFYRKNDPVKWAQVKELQGRVEDLQKIGVFDGLEKAFSLLSWDIFGIEVKDDPGVNSNQSQKIDEDIGHMARHCLGILRTNAFSRFSSKYSIECLYFLSSFMSHNCMMNTDRSFDMDGVRLVTRATRKIPKGQPVTTTYLSHLSNNTERQREMKSVWGFSCDCERCSDPTECGSFLSTIICPSCNCLTLNPYPTNNADSNENADYNWVCSNEKCENIMTDVREIRFHLHQTVWLVENDQPDINDLEATENWLTIYDNGKFLHPNHSIFLQVKLHLCQKYGSAGISSLSEEELKQKLTFCKELTAVLDKILTGTYLLKGVILFELWVALQEVRTRQCHTKETCETIDTSLEMIDRIAYKAKEILRFGPRSSAEELMFNILQEENN